MPYAIRWRDRRGKGKRPWWLMTSTGGGTRVAAKAATWPNVVMADRARDRLEKDNPMADFRVIDLDDWQES